MNRSFLIIMVGATLLAVKQPPAQAAEVVSNYWKWAEQGVVVASSPFTAVGAALVGACLFTPCLHMMSWESLINSNFPLMGYMSGLGLGLYQAWGDITKGQLSPFSKFMGPLGLLFILAAPAIKKSIDPYLTTEIRNSRS